MSIHAAKFCPSCISWFHLCTGYSSFRWQLMLTPVVLEAMWVGCLGGFPSGPVLMGWSHDLTVIRSSAVGLVLVWFGGVGEDWLLFGFLSVGLHNVAWRPIFLGLLLCLCSGRSIMGMADSAGPSGCALSEPGFGLCDGSEETGNMVDWQQTLGGGGLCESLVGLGIEHSPAQGGQTYFD